MTLKAMLSAWQDGKTRHTTWTFISLAQTPFATLLVSVVNASYPTSAAVTLAGELHSFHFRRTNIYHYDFRDGLDCGTCIAMPGCVNGGCVNPATNKSEPFKCFCDDDWTGALCDSRK